MRDLKQHKKAPARAQLPPLLKSQKLFRLDVDDDIWNDDGLGDDDDESPPRWLADQDVRDGIVALLVKDWGLEEMERIKAEEVNTMFWLRYEVMRVQRVMLNSQNNPPLSYQFETLLHDLWILNEHWQKHMDREGERKWLWMTAGDFGGAAPPKVRISERDVDVMSISSEEESEDEQDPVDEEDVLGDLCDQMEGDLLGSDGEVDVIDDTDELSSSVDGDDEEMDVVRLPVLPTLSGTIMTESSSMLPSSALATSINASALSLVVHQKDAKCYWLIPAHVPGHWTLLLVDWDLKDVQFMDSLPRRLGANNDEQRAQKELWVMLGMICEDFVQTQWQWINEEHAQQQSNSYDCGAFVLADMASYLADGVPSSMTQVEMRAWREKVITILDMLPPLLYQRMTVAISPDDPILVLDD
ncbi:hypothetical protein M422DRAFT_55331 [Sphaerobolus stellatus SS14]|uniref:Ubiquitin-like protease family profile domain-containing protein n=1 Tax=Sphaerobolus stellatus (strain SS14) TaxID=990650 RepID=A0A0C9TCF7_SPHS4|nr:hypothetical protein M422DRAFT_55331 [Sphaerobolus stellatus SS14]